VLGLDVGDTEEDVLAFIEQTQCTFPFALDSGTKDLFGWPQAISPYPRQALVGRDGTVKYLNSEYDEAALRAAIVAALAE
jgi:hypothetical protein